MKDDEEFGEITIEDQPEMPVWNKPVPYLSPWGWISVDGLNKEQAEYYQYIKDCVKNGKNLSEHDCSTYLGVYGNELYKTYQKSYKKDRSQLLQQMVDLVTIYNFSTYDITNILEKEEERPREQRIKSYSIKDKAIWVPVSQEMTEGEWKLVRGGFYWGKYVEFNPYEHKKSKKNNHTPSIKFEGPAISLISHEDASKQITGFPKSFIELSDKEQLSLLNWLAGSKEISISALAVYLSGFEVRLLGDESTTNQERAEDIRYLYRMLNNLPDILQGNGYWHDSVKKWITNLIDFTLARYFTDNHENLLPSDFVDQLPMMIDARIDHGLAHIKVSGHTQAQLAEDFKQFVRPPHELPEVFHQAFYDKLASEYQNNSRWYSFDFGMASRGSTRYEPIRVGRYAPNPQIESLLRDEPIRNTKAVSQVAEKLKQAYASVMGGLGEYRRNVNNGAPLLKQINSLPPWCDATLMPEVEKVVQELSPAPGEKYKLMKVSDLVKYFSNAAQEGDSVEIEMTDFMRMTLYRMGLAMAYPTSATMKLKYDDTTAIYDKSYPDVPSRGTMQTSLFLIAWMVQSEKVTDNDYALIDQWLRDTAAGAKWEVSAEAVMRWLINHKLTLTAKRKIRARTLAKYAKKREDLQQLLLILVNGEGFVLPKRMKRLEQIYQLIGLDPATIHSDLHRLAIEGVKKDTKATTAKGKKGKSSSTVGMLNRDKLKEITQSTAKAQEILSEVFTEETNKEPGKKKAPEKKKKADSIVTLIEKLSQKPQWTRSEFEDLISKEGETLGAMLERLNDYSYDKVDEALIEDDGQSLYIDTDVADMLLQ